MLISQDFNVDAMIVSLSGIVPQWGQQRGIVAVYHCQDHIWDMIFETRLRSISAVVAEKQKVELLPFTICISATKTDKRVIQKSIDAAVIVLSVKKPRKSSGTGWGGGGFQKAAGT